MTEAAIISYSLGVIIGFVAVVALIIYEIVDTIRTHIKNKREEEFNRMYKCVMCAVVDEKGNVIGVRRNYVLREEN